MISQKSAGKLKRIFKEEYRADLTDEETKEAGQKLVDCFSLLIEIDKKAKLLGKNEI